MSRDYGQYCGLARALDVVGDRWNLLIVRQLLMGPARFQELRDGLSGIATNLLTDRLRDLESAGVVQRQLSEGGRASCYALTDWGQQLREPIYALVRWSTPLMIRGPQGDEFRGEWLRLALPALFAGRGTQGRSVVIGVAVDGTMVQLHATPDGIDVRAPDGCALDAVLTAEAPLILGLAAGALALGDVSALVETEGDESALRAVFEAPTTLPGISLGAR
ncbi:winged helix-turn-helix transcriptional regulator [Mycolicibacter arupensis]|jgi:DNA-binding HxlR family transcriptional regulator|uniref:Transcriptional regulator n=1 Tax=Mycolicibacter arupensis TaxID=342002 RepID=A0A0F5N312_9MYCO|nr:helix-turn-helix domain-containing protein [Mycolicibacter arupensis]KAA1430028.1 helix-turn-helix transcriptional regulator [Mycolicibacter arupensis]KKC01250.1 HxlR family transcriptional regulator [Mycolicibacter arupensis]MCV7277337.1 helix-turn-helix transcriptional regulator [Mycolicibacter arupensis]OQZ99812.1 transcriptional regulator [Mycolicibacter arupensis]TXI58774.1 MAG: transcriptional regulator [Mycolicibacter arupensis]